MPLKRLEIIDTRFERLLMGEKFGKPSIGATSTETALISGF
jgi:hypothetical protein